MSNKEIVLRFLLGMVVGISIGFIGAAMCVNDDPWAKGGGVIADGYEPAVIREMVPIREVTLAEYTERLREVLKLYPAERVYMGPSECPARIYRATMVWLDKEITKVVNKHCACEGEEAMCVACDIYCRIKAGM